MEKESFKYITLSKENINKEHICCAFSDKNNRFFVIGW